MNNSAKLACLVLGLFMGTVFAQAEATPAGYSGAGFYNLANSYARAGKPGMAILNYERARLLVPEDADLEANLRYVRRSAHLPDEPRTAFDRIAGIASPMLLSWIGALGLAVIGACAVAAQLSSRHRRLRVAILLGGVLMVGLTVSNGIALWPKLHEGVVIAAASPARVSPVPMGDPLFVLPEGETVRVAAEHEGFTLVQTRSGRTGWVANSNLAPIVPRR